MLNPFNSPIVAIIQAEFLFNMKRVAVWAMIALFSFNAVLWSWGGIALQKGWAINSEFFIARLCAGFTFITTPFFVAMLMGDAVIRDFRYEIYPILLTTPIRRIEYLLGKFFGNFLVLILCSFSLMLTAFLLQILTPPKALLQPLQVLPYLTHFFVIVVITHLVLGAFCFAVGTLTRNIKLVYVLIPAFYVFAISLSIIDELYFVHIARLINPLMFGPINEIGKNISAEYLNQLAISYGSDLIINRVLMVFIAASFLAIAWWRFTKAERSTSAENQSASLNTLNLTTSNEQVYYQKPETSLPEQTKTTFERKLVTIPPVKVLNEGWRVRVIQFFAAIGTEFRLLRAERSLIIIVPITMFLCVLELAYFNGEQKTYSAVYASSAAQSLLIFLFGIAVFYTGETMHREHELKVEPLVWTTSVPNFVLLLSKFSAVFLLSLSLTVLVAVTAIVLQIYKGHTPIEIQTYIKIYSLIEIPNIAFMVGAAMTLNVVLRDKYLAYVVGLALGGGLFYLVSQGYNHWLYNPVLFQLWNYSDFTGERSNLNQILVYRIYCFAITIFCLSLAHYFYKRTN